MVLAAVVVLAILSEAAYELTSYAVRHDKEEELLFRGLSYENAIQSYYLSAPPGTPPAYPQNLQDLLEDPRYLHKRHLRALYADPLGTDWALVRAPDGGIAGVASQSREEPLKQGNFPAGLEGFEGARHYSDWIFLYNPSAQSPASGTAP